VVLAVLLAAWSLAACRAEPGQAEPCTPADLARPGPVGMPSPVAVTQTRRLNGARLDALPKGLTPPVAAEQAWLMLSRARVANGGGHDELLLGLFTEGRYSRVPAWALFTARLAQALEPISGPGVTPLAHADVCVYVNVLTVLNATNGQTFSQSTVTSD